MSEPRFGLEDFNTIAGHAYGENGNGKDRDSWLPINLTDLPDEPPAPPTLGGFGIVYHGKRHVFSGPQESAKTLAAYAIGLETLRTDDNHTLALIDFEMGARSARTRLRELGATNDELGRLYYYEPEKPADIDHIALIVALNPVLVIIDAAAGAYSIQGLDDNNRGDVEKFTNLYTRVFFQAEIATIVVDHVVKNTETRGKYAIGSERKTGGVDVHLGFDTILPIKRGSTGIYKVTTHKDRDGWHQRGRLADLHLTSDPFTHMIRWEWRQAEHLDDPNQWMPTIYMERVSSYLADDGEACSRKHLEDNVEGGTDYIRSALEHLKRLGFVTETRGPRKARMYSHTRLFTISEWETDPQNTTSPDLASTSPKRSEYDLASSPLPLGEAGESRSEKRDHLASTDSWIDELTVTENGEPPGDLYPEATLDDDIPF